MGTRRITKEVLNLKVDYINKMLKARKSGKMVTLGHRNYTHHLDYTRISEPDGQIDHITSGSPKELSEILYGMQKVLEMLPELK
jgi:hypothetical protein